METKMERGGYRGTYVTRRKLNKELCQKSGDKTRGKTTKLISDAGQTPLPRDELELTHV